MTFGVPAVITLTCPRCRTARRMDNIDGGTQYRCAGCDWYLTLGTPTVAAPGVPGSTTPVTNNTGTVVAVALTGGTVTSVNVNTIQVATTTGVTVLVPAGGTIAITYSAAPAWTWALPTISALVAVGATALTVPRDGTQVGAAGTLLMVDTGTNAEAVTVSGTPTGTSVPVVALVKGHSNGTVFGTAAMTGTYTAQISAGYGTEQIQAQPPLSPYLSGG